MRPGDGLRPVGRMRPLDGIRSIKTKLGVLVAATVAVASFLAAAGTVLGVPWLLVVPAATVVALVLTQVLARGMTSPLREMTSAARAMATGDYSRRVTTASRDEVGALARAFNTMAADLEAVDRQRRDLVANVSHELRTPVSALQALLENLVDGVVKPDPTRLQAALTQTERLGRLVSDLLDLSRLDAGISQLTTETVAVRPFLQEAVAEARLAEYPVTYQVELDPFDLRVEGDRGRLHQLVANLLDNAGKHSPDGGTVWLRAYRAGGATVLEVEDQGPGIPADQRAAVFERFTTGGIGPDGTGGTGLGLAIARWVTDLHGGSIEVLDSRRHGCMVRATLPTGTTPPPRLHRAEAEPADDTDQERSA
jgi:two-component system sensor histidine kinase BaeS